MAGRVAVVAGVGNWLAVATGDTITVLAGDVGTDTVLFVDIGKTIVGWVGTAFVELGGMVEAALSFVAALVDVGTCSEG